MRSCTSARKRNDRANNPSDAVIARPSLLPPRSRFFLRHTNPLSHTGEIGKCGLSLRVAASRAGPSSDTCWSRLCCATDDVVSKTRLRSSSIEFSRCIGTVRIQRCSVFMRRKPERHLEPRLLRRFHHMTSHCSLIVSYPPKINRPCRISPLTKLHADISYIPVTGEYEWGWRRRQNATNSRQAHHHHDQDACAGKLRAITGPSGRCGTCSDRCADLFLAMDQANPPRSVLRPRRGFDSPVPHTDTDNR